MMTLEERIEILEKVNGMKLGLFGLQAQLPFEHMVSCVVQERGEIRSKLGEGLV